MRVTEVDRRGLSGPALKMFFKIAEYWDLDTLQQMTLLGVSSSSTFFKWKKDGIGLLPKDTLERISYVMAVYKAMNACFASRDEALAWLNRASAAPILCGQSALGRMLAGNVADLYVVRQCVEGMAEEYGFAAPH
jgi:hypothetical protein